MTRYPSIFITTVFSLIFLAAASSQTRADSSAGHANPAAIAELKAGKRQAAEAAWWGFDPDDSTKILQSAIDSGAKRVTVAYMGRPWIVRPLRRRSNLELVLEPGVMLLAKKGEFRGNGDSLLAAFDVTNLVIRGYGAVLRMHKSDYQHPPYTRAEWRMGLSLNGCSHVRVEGLRIESSGGDGIMVGSGTARRPCDDILVRDCVCDDNHRQGISVTNVHKMVLENCIFSNTGGTPPSAGIDMEPDEPEEQLTECVIRNCRFENNVGHAILIYLNHQRTTSQPVSILFENCLSRMGKAGMTSNEVQDLNLGGWSGMAVGNVRDNGPKGLIEFRNCTTENTGREGAKIYDKSAASVKVRFTNCSWTNPWLTRVREYPGPRVPVFFELRQTERTSRPGGVEFIDCHVFDDIGRPTVQYYEAAGKTPLYDVSGQITTHAGSVADPVLGPNTKNVTLQVRHAP